MNQKVLRLGGFAVVVAVVAVLVAMVVFLFQLILAGTGPARVVVGITATPVSVTATPMAATATTVAPTRVPTSEATQVAQVAASNTPRPTSTPRPTHTPFPSPTPEPTSQFPGELRLVPASRAAFPDAPPNPLVVFGQEGELHPGSFHFSIEPGRYLLFSGGPQSLADLGVECTTNCLIVLYNWGTKTPDWTIEVKGSPYVLQGQLQPETSPQEAAAALVEWFAEGLAVRNGGVTAEVHEVFVSGAQLEAHWSGIYEPAKSAELVLVDALSNPDQGGGFVAQAAEPTVNWASAAIVSPGSTNTLDQNLIQDWPGGAKLLFQPGRERCAYDTAPDATEHSCTTLKNQAVSGPITLEKNECVATSGDATEFFQRGIFTHLFNSPSGRTNLTIICSASDTPIQLSFRADWGSDRSFFAATGAITPEMVSHILSLRVWQFHNPGSTVDTTILQPTVGPAFTPTPSSNCNNPELGCDGSDIVVIVFDNNGPHMLKYGWWNQLLNGGTYTAAPFPGVNWVQPQ